MQAQKYALNNGDIQAHGGFAEATGDNVGYFKGPDGLFF